MAFLGRLFGKGKSPPPPPEPAPAVASVMEHPTGESATARTGQPPTWDRATEVNSVGLAGVVHSKGGANVPAFASESGERRHGVAGVVRPRLRRATPTSRRSSAPTTSRREHGEVRSSLGTRGGARRGLRWRACLAFAFPDASLGSLEDSR